MDILGIVLAREGSKGVPGKALRRVNGRPLIEYTFDDALAARLLTARLLTSDSAEVLRLAAARGIETIERPAELATDTATVDAAARHALRVWEARHRRQADIIVLLYGNIPLRPRDAVDDAIRHLMRTGADSVRTFAAVGKHHPDWMYRLDGDRVFPFRNAGIYRRQDLEPLYAHDGAVVALTRASLMHGEAQPHNAHAFFGSDQRALIVDANATVDVDEPRDLLVAEAALRATAGESQAVTVRGEGPPATIRIADRLIGDEQPVYIIAEIGVNHDGEREKALALIDIAAECGADAVKFQVFDADALTAAGTPPAAYQSARTGETSQRDMLRRLQLTPDDFRALQHRCRQRGVEFLATPFGIAELRCLIDLGVRAIKLASTDLTHDTLMDVALATGLPMIVSTGAATSVELDRAVQRLRRASASDRAILLHCVSAYPTPLASANLRRIAALRNRYGLLTGFSDHVADERTGGWAVAAGACVLEKHLTWSRTAPGPDHACSLDAAEFRAYVAHVRQAQSARGTGDPGMQTCERDARQAARRSIVLCRDAPAGTVLTPDMFALKRPGGGIAPEDADRLTGRRLRTSVPADTCLTWDMIE